MRDDIIGRGARSKHLRPSPGQSPRIKLLSFPPLGRMCGVRLPQHRLSVAAFCRVRRLRAAPSRLCLFRGCHRLPCYAGRSVALLTTAPVPPTPPNCTPAHLAHPAQLHTPPTSPNHPTPPAQLPIPPALPRRFVHPIPAAPTDPQATPGVRSVRALAQLVFFRLRSTDLFEVGVTRVRPLRAAAESTQAEWVGAALVRSRGLKPCGLGGPSRAGRAVRRPEVGGGKAAGRRAAAGGRASGAQAGQERLKSCGRRGCWRRRQARVTAAARQTGQGNPAEAAADGRTGRGTGGRGRERAGARGGQRPEDLRPAVV
ncbi:Protein of unknown function [Gryllus bimaculatus]|nr:Protein of unknown function [Gryllus bimaculatus]